MRIQNLAVIFVIIILPITLVMQAYIRNLTNVINTEARYNEILMGSTYDAVRAYQMNTINNDYSNVNTSRQRDIKASVNSFFNSLATGLHKSGSTRAALNEYVPALMFNLYDGFYIYGPYNNVVTVGSDNNNDGKDDKDDNYTKPQDQIDFRRPFFNETVTNTENTMYGVKPFTYYSCEYAVDGQYDITINYTLDNYIAVSGWINTPGVGSTTISGAGYYIKPDKVYDNIKTTTVSQFLNGNFKIRLKSPTGHIEIEPETLGEYISFYDRVYKEDGRSFTIGPDPKGAIFAKYYKYINYNNTKYYFDYSPNINNTTYKCELDESGNPVTVSPPIFTLKNNSREYISYDQLITLANYQGWTTETTYNTGLPISRDESYSVAKKFAKDITENADAWARKYFKDVNPYYYYKKAKIFSDEMSQYLCKIDLSNEEVIRNNSFNTNYEMTFRTGEKVSDSSNNPYDSYIISNYQTMNVFDVMQEGNDPELESSSFNAHRMDVIAKTVESALIKTVSSLNDYYGSNGYVYEMPTISREDWHSIANGITVAAFMQGIPIGNYKFFNNYCIIGNTTNKEFVSKDSIYVQAKVGETNGYFSKMDDGAEDDDAYTSLPYAYITQGEYPVGIGKRLIQHDPRCEKARSNASEELIAYRRIDYLIESYEHSYTDTSGKERLQQINYFPQYGANAYECIISHNGIQCTYDDILMLNQDPELCRAYITCLAREKAAQYKNLDPMNYHRIYMYNKDGTKLLTIATRVSGEEVGVVAYKGYGNDKWKLKDETGRETQINTDYTMPYHDITIYYTGLDKDVLNK